MLHKKRGIALSFTYCVYLSVNVLFLRNGLNCFRYIRLTETPHGASLAAILDVAKLWFKLILVNRRGLVFLCCFLFVCCCTFIIFIIFIFFYLMFDNCNLKIQNYSV